jgi:hypothetical protein
VTTRLFAQENRCTPPGSRARTAARCCACGSGSAAAASSRSLISGSPPTPNSCTSVRGSNPSSHDVPAYWWSNIAVEQSPGTRVLVPADQAWRFGYGKTLDLIGIPEYDGVDLSYPMRQRRAVDFFFELAPDQRPWIAALDADGNGLVQASTAGCADSSCSSGVRQGRTPLEEWLSPGLGGHGYAEIQAGLARTQMEHLRLPAATSWHWLEAYGRLDADPQVVHSEDWNAARAGVGAVLESLLSATELTEREQAWLAIADVPTGRWWRGMDCSKRRRTTSWSGTTAVSPGGSPMIASGCSRPGGRRPGSMPGPIPRCGRTADSSSPSSGAAFSATRSLSRHLLNSIVRT